MWYYPVSYTHLDVYKRQILPMEEYMEKVEKVIQAQAESK